jgi:hypothetical protein
MAVSRRRADRRDAGRLNGFSTRSPASSSRRLSPTPRPRPRGGVLVELVSCNLWNQPAVADRLRWPMTALKSYGAAAIP